MDCRSTKKKSEKSGAAVERKEGDGGGRCYVCESVEHLAHKHCRLCRSLEHGRETVRSAELKKAQCWQN